MPTQDSSNEKSIVIEFTHVFQIQMFLEGQLATFKSCKAPYLILPLDKVKAGVEGTEKFVSSGAFYSCEWRI